MFTTNVVGANEEQQQQEDQEVEEKEEQQAKAMVNTAKFACATVAATVPSSFPPSMAYGQLPHVCVCVEALLASLWARLLPPAAACFAVLCCFLMSCHVLYEMSSASAMPKMVGSVPASGVGGYNTATAAATAAAARYRVKMKGQTTTTRTKRNAAEEDDNGRGKVRG